MSDSVHDRNDFDDFELFPPPQPASPLAPIVAENVHHLRKQQHLNKRTFAFILGISRPMLDKIESGQADIRLSYLERLADVLSVDAVELLTEHHSERSPRR